MDIDKRIEFIFDKVVKTSVHKVKDIAAVRNVLDNCVLRGKSVLEVGCGMGDNLIYCVKRGSIYAEGFDVSGESIRVAKSKIEYLPNISFRRCSLEEYSTTRAFDIILALGIFEYVEDPLKSLKKISSFLKEEGTLVLLISRPILMKRISALSRLFLSRVPFRLILPISILLSKVFLVFNSKFKKSLYMGKSSTYTIQQTILEGLMMPRYNISYRELFCQYLQKEGFSMQFFNDVIPSMICLVAQKQASNEK